MTASPEGPSWDPKPWLLRLWASRVRIIFATVVAGLVALAVTFVLPKWYRSSAVILPPEESDLLSNLSLAQRALTKFPAFGVLNEYFTPADVYKAVLHSRTVAEEVVHRFDLQRVYRLASIEKTVKELAHHTDVRLNPDGTIVVSVEDREPRRAAEMANAFLESLDRYNIEKRNSQARRTRQFLEQRLMDTDSLLRVTESQLKNYQEKSAVVIPTSATSSGVQSAADLMARKMFLEVRLGVLSSYLRSDNDEVVQVRSELEQLKLRLHTLPALQNDLQRLVRDQKVQEQLYLLLTAELEQARIRESMDTPTIQVLDRAVPPERHSRPRKMLTAGAAAFLACLGACAWITLQEPRRS